MQPNSESRLDNDFFIDERNSEKIKQEILEEDFKKAKRKEGKKEVDKKEKKVRKKPFLLLGIALMIIGATCFVMVNQGPWLYVKYEDIENNNTTIEKIYYKDFQLIDTEDEEINNFFEIQSQEYLGVSSDDFTPYLKISNYVSYAFILLGAVFTVLEIVFKIRDVDYKKSLILHSFFATTAAVICIYFILISLKFLAYFILYLLNYEIIANFLAKPLILFIVPMLLVFVFATALKICFVALKTDYKEIETILDSKKPNKSIINFRYHGGV